MNDIYEAIAIITKSKKSGKLLAEYRRWEQLDSQAKGIALSMFDEPKKIKLEKCPRCNTFRELTGWFEHHYGTSNCCEECSDGNNERYMSFRREFASI